jgi:glycosyltransferase involved in cell wall biosynthesis
MVLSELSGIPFTFETHAYDLFVNFPFAKEKIEKASVIQTESGYHREFLETCGAPREKVKIIHLSPNRQMLDELPPVRRRDDLVVSICRLHPIKGLVHALRAVARVTRVFPGLEYAIVGTGPLQQELIAESRRLGIERHVRFTGAMSNEDACALLREAAVFLLPSVVAPDGDRDGTPTAIAEAMQLEVPVISSRLSGIPELVADGVTGILTEPGDVTAIATALDRLLHDESLRTRMGRAGKEKVVREFNVDTNVAALRACWEEIMAGRPSAETQDAPNEWWNMAPPTRQSHAAGDRA